MMGKVWKFSCNNMLPKKCFQFFHDMKKKGEFCDVTFEVGKETIPAHRLIISATMPYFRDLLSKRRSAEEDRSICIQNVEPTIFKSMIEFAYSCEMEIDEDNVYKLLPVSSYYGVDEVQEACCKYLADNLVPENVLKIREMSVLWNRTELVNRIDCYVKRNFTKISKSEQFVDWPVIYLKDIIGQTDLCVNSETEVLEAVIKWVKASPGPREGELSELFRKIRMYQIKLEYLNELVEREEFVQRSHDLGDLIHNAKLDIMYPEMRSNYSLFSTEPRQSKTNREFQEEVAKNIACNLPGELEHTIQSSEVVKKEQSEATAAYTTNASSVAVLHNSTYFLECEKSVSYDPDCDSFENVACTPRATDSVGVASFKDKIYVFGGRQVFREDWSITASSSVECFDTETNAWKKATPMPTALWALSAVTLGEHIFLLGGRNESSVFCYSDKYNPVTDTYKKMSPMRNKRCYAGAVTHNGKIYVSGGQTNISEDIASHAEVYDPIEDSWTSIASMNSARSHLTLMSFRMKIYVLGGNDKDNEFLLPLDIYDPETNTWATGCLTKFESLDPGMQLL